MIYKVLYPVVNIPSLSIFIRFYAEGNFNYAYTND